MDAKVDDWVVTPRRGKAVEINALWYNALRLLAGWLDAEGNRDASARYRGYADRAKESFNRRFWNDAGGPSLRRGRRRAGRRRQRAGRTNCSRSRCRTPCSTRRAGRRCSRPCAAACSRRSGLRSLAPGHPDYKARYDGDLRARDAAYHQGTVWGWLIGPFVDAWLKVHPDDIAGARACLNGFLPHLNQACVGSVSEIFDAERPSPPAAAIAQAWSVAEVLRCWVKTA